MSLLDICEMFGLLFRWFENFDYQDLTDFVPYGDMGLQRKDGFTFAVPKATLN